MLLEDELREVFLEGPQERVLTMTTTNDGLLWVSVAGDLFAWDRRWLQEDGSQGARCLATLGFSPPPHLMAATEDGEVALSNGAFVGLYALERQLCSIAEPPDPQCDGAGGDALEEELVLKEVFVVPCRVRGALHMAIAEDGAMAAISSPDELVLVNCRELSEAENRGDFDFFATANDEYGPHRQSVVKTAVLRVDCAEWFGQGVRGGSGCVLACFLAPSQLAVLGVGNHLVSVSVDWREQAAWLVRDGHVVTRKHSVLCLSSRRGVVVLGCSDGSIKLLQSETLAVFKSIDVAGELARHFGQLREERKGALYADKPWLRPSSYPAKPSNAAATAASTVVAATVKGQKGLRNTATATATTAAAAHLSSPTYAAVDAHGTQAEKSPSGPRGENPPSLRASVLDVAVGQRDIVVALPDLVVHVDGDTYAVQGESAYFLREEDAAVAFGERDAGAPVTAHRATPSADVFRLCCAPEGSWASWCAVSACLLYYVAAPKEGLLRQPCEGDDIVHASRPLPRKWATAAERTPTPRSSASPGAAPPKAKRSQTALAAGEHPVTFGRGIRSSGYGQEAPWSVQKARKRAAAERAKRLAQRPCAGPAAGGDPAVYKALAGPYGAHRFTPMLSANRLLASDVAVHRSSVLSCTFTASGNGLVTTSGGGGYYLKLPVSKFKGDGVLLRHTTMHDGAVALSASATAFLTSAVNLSLKTPIVATGSAEGVIHLWKPCSGRTTAARRVSGGAIGSNDALRTGEAPVVCHPLPQRKEVCSVRFFYLDKFLAYAAGASLAFSPYWLDKLRGETPSAAAALQADLNRFQNRSALGAPVYTFTADAQKITSVDCVNHFASSLVVLASSNKSITVLDVNAEAPLRVVKDAHKRSIHKVVLAASSASRFVDSGPMSGDSATSQHLFASAGLDNAVMLWDLRQEKPARQLALHKNAALSTVGLAFDPTASLLAVGSEDRALYLYDTRTSSAALDIVKCSEVPSSVAFHPLEPVMALGLASGATALFSQKTE